MALRYDVAGLGSRSAAFLVDVLIQSVIGVVLTVAFSILSAGIVTSGVLPSTVFGALGLLVAALILFLLLWGYFLFFEIAWNGQTPGKRVLHIRVVRENGYPITAVDSVVRNLIRIVDWLPGIYAVGLVTMLLNDRAKRVGDFAAGTIVVREAIPRAVGAVFTQQQRSASAVLALRAEDATLVRDFLSRRAELDLEARADLAERLVRLLAQRYGLQEPAASQTDEQFLESLVVGEP